jgi:hypothetical protein
MLATFIGGFPAAVASVPGANSTRSVHDVGLRGSQVDFNDAARTADAESKPAFTSEVDEVPLEVARAGHAVEGVLRPIDPDRFAFLQSDGREVQQVANVARHDDRRRPRPMLALRVIIIRHAAMSRVQSRC